MVWPFFNTPHSRYVMPCGAAVFRKQYRYIIADLLSSSVHTKLGNGTIKSFPFFFFLLFLFLCARWFNMPAMAQPKIDCTNVFFLGSKILIREGYLQHRNNATRKEQAIRFRFGFTVTTAVSLNISIYKPIRSVNEWTVIREILFDSKKME